MHWCTLTFHRALLVGPLLLLLRLGLGIDGLLLLICRVGLLLLGVRERLGCQMQGGVLVFERFSKYTEYTYSST